MQELTPYFNLLSSFNNANAVAIDLAHNVFLVGAVMARGGNMPMFFNTDMYITKYFDVFSLPLSLFLKIYNVFDTANEINVNTDTGRAGYTLALVQAERAAQPVRGDNTLQQFYSRPDFYSAPRQVEIGVSLIF